MDETQSIEQKETLAGRTLGSRYRLEQIIGTGAMGVVYRAHDLQRDQPCAVKLLHLHTAIRESVVVRFRDEMRIIARLCHPNIVDMYDHGQDADGSIFLVMEILQGQDLHALLEKQPRLPLSRVLEIAQQVGSALHTMHLSGIVHRDIKPRNIFLVESAGGVPQVKVIDFGLAKILDGIPSTRGSDGMLIGTPEYLPPESWRAISKDIDTRADQWALAVTVYRMLSGRLPFDGGDNTMVLAREIIGSAPHALLPLVPELPVHVEAALMRALAKDREQRFPTMHDFIRALHGRPLPSALEKREPPSPLVDERPTCVHALPATRRMNLGEITAPLPFLEAPAATALRPAPPLRTKRPRARLLLISLLGVNAALACVITIALGRTPPQQRAIPVLPRSEIVAPQAAPPVPVPPPEVLIPALPASAPASESPAPAAYRSATHTPHGRGVRAPFSRTGSTMKRRMPRL